MEYVFTFNEINRGRIVIEADREPDNGEIIESILEGKADYNDTDFTDFQLVEADGKAQEDKLTVWDCYLRYLRAWADSHVDPGFQGMTPACYDEWRNCEYQRDIGGNSSCVKQELTVNQEAGVCPACGSDELDYDGFIVEDGSGIYNWTCEGCGASGRECYDLTFSEHVIDGKGTGAGDNYPCCLHDTLRTFDWCEQNCGRYYRCDTVAQAGDKSNEDNAGDGDGEGTRTFEVTITETLQQTVTVTAGSQSEAEEVVQDEWNAQDHILDADNFVGVKFTAALVPAEKLRA